jgi:hypothetical protein
MGIDFPIPTVCPSAASLKVIFKEYRTGGNLKSPDVVDQTVVAAAESDETRQGAAPVEWECEVE